MANSGSALDLLTWKDVVNSRAPKARWYGTIDKFFEDAVLPSGYQWFEWNGRVYEVQGFKNKSYADTGLHADVLDERQVLRLSKRLRLRRWWRVAGERQVRKVLTFVFAGGAWLYLCLAIALIGRVTMEQYALIVAPPIAMVGIASAVAVRK